jgi:hypothetical protein
MTGRWNKSLGWLINRPIDKNGQQIIGGYPNDIHGMQVGFVVAPTVKDMESELAVRSCCTQKGSKNFG